MDSILYIYDVDEHKLRRIWYADGRLRVQGWPDLHDPARQGLVINRRGVLQALPLPRGLQLLRDGTPLMRKDMVHSPKKWPAVKSRKESTSNNAYVQTDRVTVQKDPPAKLVKEQSGGLLPGKKPSWPQQKEKLAVQLDLSKTKDAAKAIDALEVESDSDSISSVKTYIIPRLDAKEKPGQSSVRSRSTSESSDSFSGEGVKGKEVVISEEDIQVIRKFIEINYKSFPLDKFDTDDSYKELVIYKICPYVRMERCSQIVEMIKKNLRHARVAFAKQLGLRSVDSIEDSDESDEAVSVKRRMHVATDSDGKDGGQPPRKRASNHKGQGDHSSKEDVSNERRKQKVFSPRMKIPRRMSVAPPCRNPYSSLEDHAILAWLGQSAERERLVSGNRIWQELEAAIEGLTGKKRTFHSLRNRYLRYILPNLECMGLPSHHAKRLRANYATGDLVQKKKYRPQASRENSLLVLPSVRSASSRRPREPSHQRAVTTEDPARADHGTQVPAPGSQDSRKENQPSPRKVNRSPVQATSVDAKSPQSYSDITRKFALKRLRSTPRSSDGSATAIDSPPSVQATQPGKRRLLNPRVP